MSNCNLAERCFFFAEREEEKEMREYLTGFYCAGKFNDCARYRAMRNMEPVAVSDDIFPNEDAFISIFAWAINRMAIPSTRQIR